MGMAIDGKYGLGWLRDYPDFRDYTMEHEEIKPIVQKLGITAQASKKAGPSSVDLRKWCSQVEDQGHIGSCTANAAVGLLEYYEKRAFGKYIDASRLFLYKATRNLLHWTGDTGAFLRSTMGALVLFGCPPEEYWPYDISNFDKEPSPFCYAFAQNFQAIRYYRLDPPGKSKNVLLKEIKLLLRHGLPSIFGFTVFSSIRQASHQGLIPYPSPGEKRHGGHAVLAVGYDNAIKIKNAEDGRETKGALLIKNSWGTSWGDRGYGWLPYEYVLNGLAVDWWSLLKNEWVDTGRFKQ